MTMTMTKIVALLKKSKEKEAQKELAKYIREVKVSGEDGGHLYSEMASAYIQANNNLLSQYNDFLKGVVNELQKLPK